MSVLNVLLFFILYAIGNLPDPWRPKSLITRLLLNLGTKILLACLFYYAPLNAFSWSFVFLNIAMALAAAFALYTDNYSRFFERTDLIQSVFLANLFSIGLPFRDSNTFSYAFFFPYLMGNAIALAIGFLREKELGTKNVYIENFHNFFVESKISSISLFVAILFFLGTPPLHGIVWRIALINAVYDCGRIASMVAFIICFCSVGYVYFRWMLAIFQKNSRPRVEPMSSLRNRIDIFAVVCTLGVVFCSVFRQMSLTN